MKTVGSWRKSTLTWQHLALYPEFNPMLDIIPCLQRFALGLQLACLSGGSTYQGRRSSRFGSGHTTVVACIRCRCWWPC